MGHVVDVFMYSLITDQSKQQSPYIAYMQVGKNIGTGMLVILPSVNTLRFKSQVIPTLVSTITGEHEITMTKLMANSSRVVSAHILF